MKIKSLYLFLLISILSFSYATAQVTSQSDTGSVNSGAILTTTNFSKAITNPGITRRVIRNEFDYSEPPTMPNISSPPYGSNYINDKGAAMKVLGGTGSEPFMFKDFPGIPMGNSIPPDPNMAVGPNYVVAEVNTSISIWDKNGNLLKVMPADSWFGPLLPNSGAFDPQIVYDHYDNRWIMVWDNENDATQTAYHMIAVSDDDNPLGTWYAWALPANKNGNNNSFTWGDYEHVGYDQQAVYITSNQFAFGGYFQYTKIRVIPKSVLYTSLAGRLTYTDFWNITYPGNSQKVFGIQPTVTYGNNSDYFLINAPTSNSSINYLSLYKISNPATSPVLTGSTVAVTPYYNTPNANQLGGGSMLIEAGGSRFYERGFVRGDTLWNVHAVRNPTNSAYSAVSYYKIDVSTSTAIDDITFGLVGYWYLYPALAVDPDGNVGITYSRSGTDEYVGAYFAGLKNGSADFSGSQLIRAGQGNYVVDFGSGRNRWGDYLGAALDPSNPYNIWFFTEYVSSTNTWNTHVSATRVIPFSDAYVVPKEKTLNFGNLEINHADTLSVIISNYGTPPLNITSIADSSGPYHFISNITFPYTLNTFDSSTLTFTFNPTQADTFEVVYPIALNDTSFHGITLWGNAFQIHEAQNNLLYGSTGVGNNNNFIKIDKGSGAGQNIGPLFYSSIKSITVDPVSKIIYGISPTAGGTDLVRINAEAGDSYLLYTLNLTNMSGIAFDTTGTLYAASKIGKIYKINLDGFSDTLVANAGAVINNIAFNPKTNELWATPYLFAGANADLIFKINLASDDTIRVGHTGLSVSTNDIVFDEQGNLFGVTGTNSQPNDFISIDTSTAAGTVIGSTNINDITSLTYLPSTVNGIVNNTHSNIPDKFSLMQNYPNPFNPSTTIEYNLPVNSDVQVNIYNILGELVNQLVNKNETAGHHQLIWNSNNGNGKKISSGIYFYELKAQGTNGKSFSQVKKMILLK